MLGRVKAYAFLFEQDALENRALHLVSGTDPAAVVDDALPGDIDALAAGPHGIADCPGGAGHAEYGGDLPIRHDASAGNVAHQAVDRFIEADFQLHGSSYCS